MTKTLIVPLDGSDTAERAVDHAVVLARLFDAEIRFVTTPWDGDSRRPARYLDAVAALSDAPSVDVHVARDPQPSLAIATLVAESPDPAIVMATRGRGPIGAAVLGSVAASVIREVPAPVVFVGPGAQRVEAFETVVVPLDGSARSEAVLPLAGDWARALDVPARLVAVTDPTGVEGLYSVDSEYAVTEHRLEDARALLAERGVTASSDVVPAVLPARTIVRFVRGTPAPLVCMATHGRAGLARVAVGSVAMAVVRSAPCPVLCTRPPHLVD